MPPQLDDEDSVPAVKKLMHSLVFKSATACAEALEQRGDAPREAALAKLASALGEYVALGGSCKDALAVIRLAWQDSAKTRRAVATATRDDLWQSMTSAPKIVAGLRQALNWPILTAERVNELVPFRAEELLAERVEMCEELLKASAASHLSSKQRELQVMVRVRSVLEKSEYAMWLPKVPMEWDDKNMKTFVIGMQDVIQRHDNIVAVNGAPRVSKVAKAALAAKAPVVAAVATSPAAVDRRACWNCRQRGHTVRDCQVPKKCFACGQVGHFARECTAVASTSSAVGGGGRGARERREQNVVATTTTNEEEFDTIFDYPYSYTQASFIVLLLERSVRDVLDSRPLMVRVGVHTRRDARSVECEMLVDTGAIPSVVSSRFAQSIGAAVRPSRTQFIRGVGKSRTEVAGEATFVTTLGGKSFGVTALVADTTLFDFLLGTRGMRAQGVGPVQIELNESGGRVRVAGGKWVSAVGWSNVDVSNESVLVLRDESAMWTAAPSSVFMPLDDVGVLHAQLVLGQDDGLTVADVLEVMGFSTAPPVALVTGQEERVVKALRAMADAEREGRDGAAWTLPDLTPSAPIVPPGPALQGADVEAFKSVSIGPDLGPARAEIEALCKEFSDVLGGSKGEGVSMSPPMNKKQRAIKLVLYPKADLEKVVARFRRTSPDDAKLLEEFALKMEAEGRLRRETNAPASSLALVVKKSDGSRRVVVNFGPLNTQLLSNHFPLPRIDESLDFLAQGEFRSSFDLWSCFHQFGLSPESIPLTATWFSPRLLMSWLVAPMGIKVVPAAVQSVMSADFDNDCTITYIDDILQRVQTAAEVVQATRHVFSVCRTSGWTLNARKCKIGFRELPMLGRIVGPGVIKVKPDHLDGIKNYGMPTTYRQLRKFNGMLTALAKHLPSAASTIRLLYEAAGGAKQGRVMWTDEMRAAFSAALHLLASPEVVVPFDESRPLLLLTDWSVDGGAGVFAHLARDGSHFEIIDTFSHANSSAERNYAAAEGEIAMVRLALKQFPHLMMGRKVHWVTDALTMKTAFEAFRASASPRIRRTVAELQHVEIAVIDSPGEKHCIADALSRNPSFATTTTTTRDAEGTRSSAIGDEEVLALVSLAVGAVEMTLPLVDPDDDIDDKAEAPELALPHRPALESAFDPPSAQEADEIEAFRLRDHSEIRESREETKRRWAARTADDPDLAMLRELAARNDATIAAGGEITMPADSRSIEAMMPRHDADGLLYVKVGGVGPWRVVVPAGCESEVVHALHAGTQRDGAGAAHWHARRVVAVARRWFWWRTMYRDVAKWCQQCTACQRHRLLQSKAPGNLGDSEAGRVPVRLADWQLDSYELPGEHFFTAIEVFSGLVLVAPVADQTSASFVQAFEQMVVQPFGVPQRLWLDGGNEMKRHFSATCLAYGIDIVDGQAYNPQSQARVERAHRTMNAAVTKARMEGATASLATILARVAHEINIAPNELTEGLSPHRLLHGVEPSLPFTRFFNPDLDGLRDSSPHANLRSQVRELALVHASTAVVREADRQAKRAKHEAAVAKTHGAELEWQPGDAVWAILPPVGVGSKLAQREAWSGPWEVVSFDSVSGKVELAYLSDTDARFEATVHVRNTRPFSAQRPLEPRHLLDESVFPKGWEKSTAPLGGLAQLPERVREGLDAAIDEAARQAALSEERRKREEAKELAEKEAQAKREKELQDEAMREQQDAQRDRKVSEAKARQRAKNEALLQEHVATEVLEIDRGNRRVRVKRKNGSVVWVDNDDVDDALKSLVADFETKQRANRVEARARARV